MGITAVPLIVTILKAGRWRRASLQQTPMYTEWTAKLITPEERIWLSYMLLCMLADALDKILKVLGLARDPGLRKSVLVSDHFVRY